MKYGKHAVEMLVKYFKGELVSIDEDEDDDEDDDENIMLKDLTGKPPLLDWVGTSFGLTERLMKYFFCSVDLGVNL